MRKAKKGDKVKVHITGHLEEGRRFATTQKSDPLQFEIGKSSIMSGIQEAVIGMEPKEQKQANVPPEKGFGRYRNELIKEVRRELLPDDLTYEKGKTVKLPLVNGKSGDAKVLEATESTVTLDLNHPLAGKNLIFDISLLEIV